MGRHPLISDEKLVELAREVFLERGVAATVADVAERAGVSEALVFHRFKTKDALFAQAMALPIDPPWLANLPARVGRGDIRDELTEMSHEGIAFFRIIVPAAMMHWSLRAEGKPHGLPAGSDSAPMRGLKKLAGYFEAEMRLGRLGRHDAEVAARTWSGALWEYVSMEIMFEGSDVLPLPQATFVRSLVALLLDGLTPRPKGRSKS